MKIRVRVWDIDAGKMSAGIDLGSFMQDDEELEFPKTEESLPLKDFLFFRKEFSQFMLSTGITDRDNNEIFEDDLVSTPSGTVFQVVFDFDRWKFKGNNKFKPTAASKWQWKAIIVVGNIHETPELFK